MGLSPAARAEYGLPFHRVPASRPKPVSRTSSSEPDDHQPAPGRSAEPQSEESVGCEALVQLLPRQPQQDTLEETTVQQGEKPAVSVETTSSQKRAELNPTPKAESEGRLTKQAAEGKARPRPGDLIEIFRIGYEHWAIYVENDCVVHLAPPSKGEEFEAGSITSVFSNRAVVKYSRLEDVLHGCSWKVNNKLDRTYLPLPVDKIIQRTKQMVNKTVQYSLIEGNCEHFVNDLRYGVARSQQWGGWSQKGECLRTFLQDGAKSSVYFGATRFEIRA